MPYLVAKVLHHFGIALLCVSLGAVLFDALTRRNGEEPRVAPRVIAMAHGLALVTLLVSGIELVRRLHLPLTTWLIAKAGLWLVMGAALAVARRKPRWAAWLWWAIPGVVALAAFLAIRKPML